MARSDGPMGRVQQTRRSRSRAVLHAETMPAPTRVPIDTDRTRLYSAAELYGPDFCSSGPYTASLDARIYAWSLEPGDRADHLAQVLHDHAVDEALETWLAGRRLVGVMGGHDTVRGAPAYADAARLGHGLGAAGLVVATGGGPGAMEAANLGCRLAGQPAAELDRALRLLAEQPSFHPVDEWLRAARAVLEELSGGHDSLGVPTWFYGHEPTNLFATSIAKYFRNSTREAILLQICGAGIAYLPGAAGTVQEVFQDACENYYALGAAVAPMVLVGIDFWTRTVPAWPLLQALAEDRPMAGALHLVDSVDEAVAVLSPTAR